jgi:hypothetical protein
VNMDPSVLGLASRATTTMASNENVGPRPLWIKDLQPQPPEFARYDSGCAQIRGRGRDNDHDTVE